MPTKTVSSACCCVPALRPVGRPMGARGCIATCRRTGIRSVANGSSGWQQAEGLIARVRKRFKRTNNERS